MTYIQERRQEERDRRRGEILDAAEALYADAGWDTVTMDQLARRARLSRALIYVYFRDKTDLHFAIVERALERLRGRVTVAVASTALGLDQLEAIGWAYMAFAREEPHRFDACARFEALAPGPEGTEPASAACLRTAHQVHEIVAAAIVRGVADGSIRSDVGDPLVTSLSLWAFTHGAIQVAQTKGGQLAHEGIAIDTLMACSVQLIRRALEPPDRPA
jgi:AcrR family transcriptional regulator